MLSVLYKHTECLEPEIHGDCPLHSLVSWESHPQGSFMCNHGCPLAKAFGGEINHRFFGSESPIRVFQGPLGRYHPISFARMWRPIRQFKCIPSRHPITLFLLSIPLLFAFHRNLHLQEKQGVCH